MRAVRAAPACLVDLRTLERYCMGRLDAAESASITNHINDCPSCAQYLTEIEAMSRALRHAALQARGTLMEPSGTLDSVQCGQRQQVASELHQVEARLAEISRLVQSGWGADSREARYAEQILNVIVTFRRELSRERE
jgi:anti-sigma factor ChrR (cupin superfamily)